MAAARTSGINSLEREKADLEAIPITTGINTAAVPVVDKSPDIRPVITITEIIRRLSVFANYVTLPPTFCAMPVSKKAAPTMNIAIHKRTLLSTKPAKASSGSITPVKASPTATILAVTDKGIFSKANITIAKIKNIKVITEELILYQPLLVNGFILYIVL